MPEFTCYHAHTHARISVREVQAPAVGVTVSGTASILSRMPGKHPGCPWENFHRRLAWDAGLPQTVPAISFDKGTVP